MAHDNGDDQQIVLSNQAGGADADQESRRRRQKLLAVLRGRYHWAIVAALLLGAVGAVTGYFMRETYYTSNGRFELKQQVKMVFGDDAIGRIWEGYVNTRMAMISSPQVIGKAIASEGWKRAAQAAGVQYSPGDFADGVWIHLVGESNMIDIGFKSRKKQLAQPGAEALMAAYKEVFDQKEQAGDLRVLEILQGRAANLAAEARRLQDTQRAMAGEDDLETIQAQYEVVFEELLALQSQLKQVEMDLQMLTSGSSNLAGMSVAELAGLDATLAALLEQKRLIEQDIELKKLRGVGAQHYLVQNLKASLTIMDNQIAQRARMLRSGMVLPDRVGGGSGAGVEQLQVRKREIQRQLTDAEQRLARLGQRRKQLMDLEQQIVRAESELRHTRERIEQMTTNSLVGGRLIPISPPSDASKDDPLKRVKMAIAGGVAGAAAGIGLIVLIGLLDPRLRHVEEAEADLPNTRMLGILPTLPADLADPEQAVLVAHSVHHIRTLLQIGRGSEQGYAFSITSPAAGSGKTSLTMALGLSFAASGCKTLLIDADIVGGGLTRRMGFVVHPRLGQVLRRQDKVTEPQIEEALRVTQTTGGRIGEGLVQLQYATDSDVQQGLARQREQSVGLLEACNGEHRFEECVAPTGIDNLFLLPIGAALPQHAGSLSPKALRQVIGRGRDQFDAVLIDTGPLLGSLEACMAAAEVNATILIVSRGDQKPMINKCIEHLRTIGGRLAGIVFNHALANDIARSAYGSVTMSQSRHPNHQTRPEPIDADTSARFGPLATAVASYGGGREAKVSSTSDRVDARTLETVGNGTHAHSNGHASRT